MDAFSFYARGLCKKARQAVHIAIAWVDSPIGDSDRRAGCGQLTDRQAGLPQKSNPKTGRSWGVLAF